MSRGELARVVLSDAGAMTRKLFPETRAAASVVGGAFKRPVPERSTRFRLTRWTKSRGGFAVVRTIPPDTANRVAFRACGRIVVFRLSATRTVETFTPTNCVEGTNT
jgi:hypothetical protein